MISYAPLRYNNIAIKTETKKNRIYFMEFDAFKYLNRK